VKRAIAGILLIIVPFLAVGRSQGSLSGPALGYLYDSSLETLRPILGIEGSSTIGGPIDLGFTLTGVVALPDQRNFIAAPSEGSFLVSIDMGASPPVSHSIRGAAKSVAEISVSPHGTAAALSYPATQLVQVVTGLPYSPAITLGITTSLISAPLRRVVVNDDASVLVMTFQENDRETIYRWNRTEGFRLLASTVEVGALTFVGSSDLVYADSGTNEVYLARDIKRQSVTKFVAGADDGVSGPAGAGLSNRNEILLANASSGSIMALDTDGRILRNQDCDCKISGLFMLGAGMFRLTDRLDQTIYYLDFAGAENRILFIPPLQ
jgi:hypothetical protein